MPREHRERERKVSPKAMSIFGKINSDVRALNSGVLILSQKMKYVVRNEKILGRNLVVLNKKFKALELEGGAGAGSTLSFSQFQAELASINQKLEEFSNSIAELRSEVESIKETFAKQEELKEIKFVVDAINPLEFVTRKDLEEILLNKQETVRKKS